MLPLVPGPVNVPPEVVGVNVIAGSFKQAVPGSPVKAGLGETPTETVRLLVPVQPPEVTV